MARRTEASNGPARALTTPPPARRPHATTASAHRRTASRPVPGNSPRSASRDTCGSSARWCRWATPRWATTSSTTVGAGPPAPGDEAQVGRHARAPRGRRGGATPRHRHRPGRGCAARRAPRPGRRATARAGARGSSSGRSSTTRAGPAARACDHVAHRGLGHARRCSAAGRQHGSIRPRPGSSRQQRLGWHPAADVPQVVPPPPGQVLDAGRDLETAAQQVEVDDDRRRTGGREPAPDGEREGARPQAAGGTDDSGHSLR